MILLYTLQQYHLHRFCLSCWENIVHDNSLSAANSETVHHQRASLRQCSLVECMEEQRSYSFLVQRPQCESCISHCSRKMLLCV